ncbi:hypothetical protein G3I19_04545 [Streptomyces sp. SID10853]|nr:hypothetical protein [Streptomyces sp. SID10853]
MSRSTRLLSGSFTGCAWTASWFVPGKAIKAIGDAIRAVDASMRTGIGVRDALTALKALDLDAAALAKLEDTVHVYEDILTACKTNSFPGETQVLLADGTHRPIRDIHIGDLVMATDPSTGRNAPEPITDTCRHGTDHLVDIVMTDGSSLTSTTGHRLYVVGRGWTRVSGLSTGVRLRTQDGTVQTVTGLHDRPGLAPQEVFGLTVGGLHTFYVSSEGAQRREVLVHNCTNIVADEGIEGAHTLRDHVVRTDKQMADDAIVKGIATRWNDEATAAQSQTDQIRRVHVLPAVRKNPDGAGHEAGRRERCGGVRRVHPGYRAELDGVEVRVPGVAFRGGLQPVCPQGRAGRRTTQHRGRIHYRVRTHGWYADRRGRTAATGLGIAG